MKRIYIHSQISDFAENNFSICVEDDWTNSEIREAVNNLAGESATYAIECNVKKLRQFESVLVKKRERLIV